MSDPDDLPFGNLSPGKRLRRAEEMIDAQGQPLLEAIKARLPELQALLEKVSSRWHAEDGFYRFYYQSSKVYGLQVDTVKIVEMLKSLLPDRSLNAWFSEIIRDGTGRVAMRSAPLRSEVTAR